MTIVHCMSALTFGVLAATAPAGAPPMSPALAEIQQKMSGHAQLHVSGEQVYFMPANATRARQYERFTLAYDRDGQRFRLSYARFGGASAPRTDIEAWGTLDCLNLLRADRTPPGIINAKSQTCVKHVDPLLSMLSEGIGILSAPVIVLSSMVSDTFWPRANAPHSIVNIAQKNGHSAVTVTFDNNATETTHYWLNADGDRIDKADREGQGDRFRATYSWLPAPTDVDFAYTPDPELVALAEIGKNPQANRAKLEDLAKHGSKAAELQLAFTEEASAALFFGWPRGHPDMTERMWSQIDALQAKGFGSARVVQARWLVRADTPDVPKRFQAMTAEQRKANAKEFFWDAAKSCDPQALQDLERALAMGDEIFEPNPLKLGEFESVKNHCDDVMTPPELKTAASRVADPWP